MVMIEHRCLTRYILFYRGAWILAYPARYFVCLSEVSGRLFLFRWYVVLTREYDGSIVDGKGRLSFHFSAGVLGISWVPFELTN